MLRFFGGHPFTYSGQPHHDDATKPDKLAVLVNLLRNKLRQREGRQE